MWYALFYALQCSSSWINFHTFTRIYRQKKIMRLRSNNISAIPSRPESRRIVYSGKFVIISMSMRHLHYENSHKWKTMRNVRMVKGRTKNRCQSGAGNERQQPSEEMSAKEEKTRLPDLFANREIQIEWEIFVFSFRVEPLVWNANINKYRMIEIVMNQS